MKEGKHLEKCSEKTQTMQYSEVSVYRTLTFAGQSAKKNFRIYRVVFIGKKENKKHKKR